MKAIYKGVLHNREQAVGVFKRAWAAAEQGLQGGNTLELTVEPPKRTKAQNARYWGKGVLAQIAEKTPGKKYSAEIWHELFKRMFIGVEQLPNGQVIGKSSTKLSKAEFCAFSDEVEAYAIMELGVVFEDLKPHG
jgi:hypothetical protein